MDKNKQKSAKTGGSAGANADSEEEEQDEPSSSSNQKEKTAEDELESFREKWQQELRSQPTSRELLNKKAQTKFNFYDSESQEDVARALFIKGTELEKAGQLYEAIQFYRKAVQIVPDIEFKLDNRPKPLQIETKTENYEETHETDNNSSSDGDDDDDDGAIEDGQLYARIQKKVTKMGHLCASKFDQSTTHISSLPLEILLYILKWVVSTDLDLRSLESFGTVCRGFYLCARDPEIWRLTCLRIWGLNCSLKPDNYGSWRNMFIERPRLNFNGCYISKTSYIRHGENSFQDQFYRPWHLVTYYRYLRFFPEGVVLMLTSPDEPTQCVGQMKNRHPRQPIMVGYYRLKDDTVTLVFQRQDTAKTMQTTYKRSARRRDVENPEQTFHMELKIQSRKSRRHVKLVWSYYSIFTKSKQGHENTTSFDLIQNRFPPLWYSRVKSFTSESDQPLN
ncbi:unnamed protein product [Ceutorhynchus assimilis]|uniref:F-box only protein 9 n=1 Tax=Ceutorhynchus assimilis TaxID=467358 RepID=A0A9N9MXG3_9CUCU|nr:unnamed protein product [Ceutorhynchus assimilis]